MVMIHTQIPHTSHKEKDGYVWRKRYAAKTIELVLQTREADVAQTRAAAITMRFMQLEVLGVPADAMRETLKGYRNELVREGKLASLQAMLNAQEPPQASVSGEAMQSPSQSEKVAVIALQGELEGDAGHTLEEAKKSYISANTEWAAKTEKDYSINVDRFIVWAAANNIHTVEAMTKADVVTFKAWMDEEGLAPNTKQKVINRLSSFFKHCADVMEWIDKNPFAAMGYKKVEVLEKKEEITKAQQEVALAHPLWRIAVCRASLKPLFIV